jgi:hypothetical protein
MSHALEWKWPTGQFCIKINLECVSISYISLPVSVTGIIMNTIMSRNMYGSKK